MDAKMECLNMDLNDAMAQVRQEIAEYGMEDWQEYLLVRKPGVEGGFVVIANSRDKSNVAQELIEWHKARAGRGE